MNLRPGVFTLNLFTGISLILLILWLAFSALALPAMATLSFLLGVLGCTLTYFLYAVRCWRAGSRFLGALMPALPLFVCTLIGGTVDPEVNFWLYVFFLFVFSVILTAIPVAVVAAIQSVIGHFLSGELSGVSVPQRPALRWIAVGLVLMTLFGALMGGVIQARNTGALQENVLAAGTGGDATGTGGGRFTGLIPSVVAGIAGPVRQPSANSPAADSAVVFGSYGPHPSATPDPAVLAGSYQVLSTGRSSPKFVYYLRGTRGTISLPLYSGVYSNISQNPGFREPGIAIPRGRYYDDVFDNPVQKEYLRPLVESIRNNTPSQDDQVRIAISLVQHISYDHARGRDPGPVHPPYITLYDQKGVCQDKSVLLAYLLQELGYDAALMTFVPERHMVVGIRAPAPYEYRQTGYAFIETTIPAIPTYVAPVPRLESIPALYKIHEGGYWFDSISEESDDAQHLVVLVNQSGQNGLDLGNIADTLRLTGKYGL